MPTAALTTGNDTTVKAAATAADNVTGVGEWNRGGEGGGGGVGGGGGGGGGACVRI